MKNAVRITGGYALGFAVHYALLECLYIINERFPAWKGGALALLCFFADLTLIILLISQLILENLCAGLLLRDKEESRSLAVARQGFLTQYLGSKTSRKFKN